jgi:hypothetical protein
MLEEIWVDINIGNVEYLKKGTKRKAIYKERIIITHSTNIMNTFTNKETIDILQKLFRKKITEILKEYKRSQNAR